MRLLRYRIFKYYKLFILLIIGVIFIKIAFNANKFGVSNWQSAYWADASGYYIYLPAAFIHGFYAENYPDGVEKQFGNGFTVDRENNKIITKYPIGIAMLTFPFFLIFHLLAFILGFEPNGFSKIYYFMPAVATPFYLLMGLLCLYKFLKHYVNKTATILSLLAIVLGTNLYYFAFISPYMTHVYSFAIFSFFLFVLKKYILSNYKSTRYLIFLSLSTGFIFLTRPTNLIILLLIPFLDVNSLSSFSYRIKSLFTIKKIFLFIIIFLITIFPQLLYWKFISGSFFYYSYGDEGFTYLLKPKIIEVLFAPLNGMLLYSPIIFIFFVSLVLGLIRKHSNSTLIFLITILSVYIISSWGCFYYGCGYGCRPFIEYLAILALPFAQLLQNSKRIFQVMIVLIGMYLIYFNLNLIYRVYLGSPCFLAELGNKPEYILIKNPKVRLWNWREYKIYLEKAKIFPFKSHHYIWKNNFEPDFADYFDNQNKNTIERKDAPSGKFATTTKNEFSDGFYYVKGERISNFLVNHLDISAHINQMEVDSNAFLVCQINLDDSIYFWKGEKIVELTRKQKEWDLIHTSFELPYVEYAKYSIYFWSPQKKNILIDDLKVDFKY